MSLLNSNLSILLRRIVFTSVGKFDRLTNRQNQLFILCYHAVGNDSWRFGVQKKEIVKQMKFLLKTHKNVSLGEIEDHILGKKAIVSPSFAITFDDGYKDILEIKESFASLGLKPTVFILGDTTNANRSELENGREFLSKKDVFQLQKSGWDIQSHSMTHAYLPECKNINYEVNGSRENLLKELGISTKYIAYPKGGYTTKVIKLVKKSGYKMGLSMDDGKIDRKTNIYAVPRIGVDRSHLFDEFKILFSPSVVAIRGFIKRHNFI